MKKLWIFALTLAMALSATGCSSSSSGDADKTSLKISHHPYLHGLPSTYAAENGLYDEFDYTIDYYSGGPVQNEAIASDAWEVGTTGIGGAVLGIPGYNMKIIGVAYDEDYTTDMWVRSDSDLVSATVGENGVPGTADDWRGKTVLIASGGNTHLNLILVLEDLGLSDTDVNIIDCSSVPNVYAAFMSGEGDVAFLWAPYGYELEQNSAYCKIGSVENYDQALPALIVCTEDALENRPEVVQEWLSIYYESSEALMADTAAAAELMYTYSEEQGIVMGEYASEQEFVQRPLWSLEESKSYFVENENGTTDMYDLMMDYADFMVTQGKLTQEQRDAMAESGFVSDMILDIG